MRHVVYISALLAWLAVFASSAFAQGPSRVFVSGHGSDSNPCSLTQPCRTFQAGVNAVASGGEVIALDSAGYGGFSVNKSATIEAPSGVYAGVSPSGGIGISIGVPTGEVVLRGLNVVGHTSWGIAPFAGIIHIENCTIDGFGGGIVIESSTPTSVFVKDTVIRNCVSGILSVPDPGGPAILSVDHCKVEGGIGDGIMVSDSTTTTIRDSIITGFRGSGFYANVINSGFMAQLNIDHCQIYGNGNGIVANTSSSGETAIIRVSGTLIAGNGFGVGASVSSGTAMVISYGDNKLSGNGTDGVFNSVIALQ